jgi:4-diphosphocytidyl-2-C-methyl-D-erythritol kinase
VATQAVYTVEAPAKLNLHLDILGRRPDGYHDLRSLFIAVDAADRLRVTLGAAEDGDGLRELVGGVDDRRNTIVRAVELYRRAAGTSAGVGVTVEKRIPLGAGLGGGSSDAAAALRALNHAAAHPLPPETLLKLGAGIGSDVPFFLAGARALVEGRGEKVRPLPIAPRFALVLLVPDFSVDTADAYRRYDHAAPAPPGERVSSDELVRSFAEDPPEKWRFFNSFSSLLFYRFPVFARLETALRAAGALFTGVSGSGSSFFGVFPNRWEAETGLAKIEGRFRFAGVVEPLAELPPVVAV